VRGTRWLKKTQSRSLEGKVLPGGGGEGGGGGGARGFGVWEKRGREKLANGLT
jgi:hypothetical protein